MSATADAMPTRSQEPFPGTPRGCRVSKLWAFLDCSPGPQAGSWKGSRAAGILGVQGEDLNHCAPVPDPKTFFLRFIYFYWKVRYTERRKDREEELPSSLLKWLQCWNWANLKPGASSGSPTWVQGPKTLGLPWLFSQATGRELDGRWSCWD